MWRLRSLGYRTDLFVAGFDGIVEYGDRYVVLRTPSNPDFWWGNFLIYPEPPGARAAERGHAGSWLDDFDREFPHSRAPLLAWDCPDGATGDLEAFLREGFAIDESTILTATAAQLRRPPHWPDDVEALPFQTDLRRLDWERASRTLTSAFAANRSGSLLDLRVFVDRQLLRYQAMQAQGIGQWFGAFVDGEMAAVLGMVRDGDIARFQLVGTDPRFARRGICGRMVYGAARVAFEKWGVQTLVMAADASYHAARIYEAVGFTKTEHLVALVKKPPRV
jgi:hypothetical protein